MTVCIFRNKEYIGFRTLPKLAKISLLDTKVYKSKRWDRPLVSLQFFDFSRNLALLHQKTG